MNISAVLKDLNNPSNAYDTSGEESSDDEAPAGDNRALCDAYEEEEHEQTITIPHDFDDIVDEPVQPPAHSTPTTASAGDAMDYKSDKSTLSPDLLEPYPHPESDNNAMGLDTPHDPREREDLMVELMLECQLAVEVCGKLELDVIPFGQK